jgi:hypothetical protein
MGEVEGEVEKKEEISTFQLEGEGRGEGEEVEKNRDISTF